MAVSRKKRWRQLEEFPRYLINRKGEIYSLASKRLIKTQISRARGDFWFAVLFKDGKQYRRGVIPLIEKTFERSSGTVGEWSIPYRGGKSSGIRMRDSNGRFTRGTTEDPGTEAGRGSALEPLRRP